MESVYPMACEANEKKGPIHSRSKKIKLEIDRISSALLRFWAASSYMLAGKRPGMKSQTTSCRHPQISFSQVQVNVEGYDTLADLMSSPSASTSFVPPSVFPELSLANHVTLQFSKYICTRPSPIIYLTTFLSSFVSLIERVRG